MCFTRLSKTTPVIVFLFSIFLSHLSLANDPIDINKADVEVLTQLRNVGVKKAQAIVAYREQKGGFKAVDELTEVKGIGQETLEVNRSNLIASQ